ncbi:bifunctional demethylmenaquinone methyltransferase/2-methoxy-6-polyprenyl-1,4-benzoquinol methylase UbiE [Anaerolineales bacterium]
MAHLKGQEKADYVQDMFGRVAERYNTLNRVMSLGQDMKWRKYVVKTAQIPENGVVVDLATGTGDIAFEVLKQVPSAQVIGSDFALPMMMVGQRNKEYGQRISWCGTDAMNLPHPDQCFDAVISGYLVRNVIDITRTLEEQLRVLKAGGRVVILDTSPPPNNLLKPFIKFHLNTIIPILGRIIGGKSAADAYKYLPDSTQAFKTPEALADLLRQAGFQDVGYKTFMLGTMAVHWGTKPE